MTPQLKNRLVFALVSTIVIFFVSCEKPNEVVSSILPIETYQYRLYDSVEGNNSSTHYALNRTIHFQFDPNLDKCYMPNHKAFPVQMDTFNRHHFWKRGYVNQNDFYNRIVFNGDTITIHHRVNNQIGESGFRYTHGIKQ